LTDYIAVMRFSF